MMPGEIAFDAARLIADLRRGDPGAIAQAYRITFAAELGRLVLAHHLAECGVGNALAPSATSGQTLFYAAGRHDGALLLATAAGYDQASLAVAVLTDQLEGTSDDAAFNHPAPLEGYEPGSDEDF